MVTDTIHEITPISSTGKKINDNKIGIHLSDTTEVRAFIKKVQKSITENDTLAIVHYFKYPLRVGYIYEEGGSIWVYSSEEFIAHKHFTWVKCLLNVRLLMEAHGGENDPDIELYFYMDELENGIGKGNLSESINSYVRAIEIIDTCNQSSLINKTRVFIIERVERELKITGFN
jgi:hypothetical protein